MVHGHPGSDETPGMVLQLYPQGRKKDRKEGRQKVPDRGDRPG